MITASQWRKAVTPLLDDPAQWGWRPKLAYHRPIGWVLRGVVAEGSGFVPDRVYVAELHMPLFVPHESIWLTHGERVPNGAHPVGLDDEREFVATLRQAIAKVPAEDEALAAIAATATEESAYALLLLGRTERAAARLAEPFWPDDDRPFVEEARRRRSQVADALRSAGPDAAVAILREWRDATVAAVQVS